jgi:hypothetical protein
MRLVGRARLSVEPYVSPSLKKLQSEIWSRYHMGMAKWVWGGHVEMIERANGIHSKK